jgi:co-chaperonin GroES (HSP10)
MKPLRNYILVRQETERVFQGGISVPTGYKIVSTPEQLGRFGKVEAIGPDVDADQVPVGSRVLFGEFEFPRTPGGLVILTDMDIAGVVEE